MLAGQVAAQEGLRRAGDTRKRQGQGQRAHALDETTAGNLMHALSCS